MNRKGQVGKKRLDLFGLLGEKLTELLPQKYLNDKTDDREWHSLAIEHYHQHSEKIYHKAVKLFVVVQTPKDRFFPEWPDLEVRKSPNNRFWYGKQNGQWNVN